MLDQILNDLPSLPSGFNRQQLLEDVLTECTGYGAIEELLHREDVREIMVNSFQDIFYRTDSEVRRSRSAFSCDQALVDIIQRLLVPSGRHLSTESPLVDARLSDGSRMNAVLPPLSARGPSLTIRKMIAEQLSASHLVNFETLNHAMLRFLQTAVQQRKNIIISGGTGTGKSTLLNILSRFIPAGERIVTIEDAAELDLPHPNLVALEARPSNPDGSGLITIRDLVINSLRMSPDRIIVGECRGGEALDMLQAMNTGHDGSLTTLHANSPRDCLNRLEVLVLMSGIDLPVTSIRSQISSAIDYVVQITRFPCGTRKVTSISEISGMEAQIIQLGEIYRFQQADYQEKGKVHGEFVATGYVPRMMEQLRDKGGTPDFSIFE
jgi:pilus assembly protein CpaF